MSSELKMYCRKLCKYYNKELFVLFIFKFISVLISAVCIQFLPALLLDDLIDLNINVGKSIFFCVMIIMLLNLIMVPLFDYFFKEKKITLIWRLHRDMYESIICKDMCWFDKTSSGEVISYINNDSQSISSILDDIIPQICYRISYGIGSIIIIFIVDWRFGFGVVAMGIIILLTRKLFMDKIIGLTEKILHCKKAIDEFVTEILASLQALIDLPLTENIFHKYKKSINNSQNIEVLKIRERSYMVVAIQFILEISIYLIWLLYLFDVHASKHTIGTYTSLLLCIKSALNFFNLIIITYMDANEALVGVANIFSEYNLLKEQEDCFSEKRKLENCYELCIENLNFCYKSDEMIFDSFSLKINDGELVEIRGAKGSGKTTLIKIILGLYKDYKGHVLLGGVDIRQLNVYEYIAYVPTNSFFWEGSVMYNIILKNECSYLEEKYLKHILKILDFNMFLGEEFLHRSINLLSSGEKQRVAIARALFRNTPIIILDEFNANLDECTEKKIFDNMVKEYGDKTIIFINHRTEYPDSRKVFLDRCYSEDKFVY